ncbi:MAG: MBOAT family O-acyltransferase [Rhodospirillales bacterium]
MLFNSVVFIFAFLPVVLFLGHVCKARASETGIYWILAVSSMFFYCWAEPTHGLLLFATLVGNFVAGRYLAQEQSDARARKILAAAIVGDLVLLGYFKYTNFLILNANSLVSTSIDYLDIALPLAISFFIFQQIMFLLDVRAGKAQETSFLRYVTFVTFFPQLLAGPIVHHADLMPQLKAFGNKDKRLTDLAVGFSIFAIGLFKKVVIADNLATDVDRVFALPGAGETVGLVDGWAAAVGFTLQLYFDFSAYSDMAVGLGKMFGVNLPINFYSPLKSTSMIVLWRRWHMTVMQFFMNYVYVPLNLAAMRLVRRTGISDNLGRFAAAMIGPVMITFVLSGLWHGAGWGFIICMAINGAAVVVNSLWTTLKGPSVPRVIGWFATMVIFVISLVFFRAGSVDGAISILSGMFGLSDLTIPERLVRELPAFAALAEKFALGVKPTVYGSPGIKWALFCMAIALFAPNIFQIFRHHFPAGYQLGQASTGHLAEAFTWKPTIMWNTFCFALLLYAVVELGLYHGGHSSQYIYFQF